MNIEHRTLSIEQLPLRPMKWLCHILLLATMGFLAFVSCSEEEIQAEGIEPFVTVKFINQDSVKELDTAIAQINADIKVIDDRIAEIDAAENRSELRDEKDSLNDVKSSLNKQKTRLSSIRSRINSGKIILSSLSGTGGIDQILSADSATQHQFPINSNSTSVRFFTVINGRLDTLDFTYNLSNEFIENQLRAIASNLEVNYFTFDSVKLVCGDSTCISNEAELTAYF
ncbi:hypothetical protein [Fulvivirga lutea]|uniref:Uncharacterized protein n=1 Tax=Fulvivirga lutea TaxID=2810512 RepID=A0A974WF39_9BACT|nr:hypothetical protein [Fulvivirga lutea]QSE97036.1 hypothetical protein JR347_15790 [Fulvivirga lutea]